MHQHLEQMQLCTEEASWLPPSVLPRTERALRSGAISREMIAALTPQFLGESGTDEALVALLPRLEPAARRYYAGRRGALRELLTGTELKLLDRWLSFELARLTPLWRALEAAADRRAAALNAIPTALRADHRKRVIWLRVERIARRIEASTRCP